MFQEKSLGKSSERLLEEQIYEQVAIEISNGDKRDGLWAKALADSDGSLEKLKGLYIKYRVQSIKDELLISQDIAQKKDAAYKKEHQIKIRTERNRAAMLILGIFILPYVFSWFTLAKGYSNTMRFISFAWLLFALLSIFLDIK